MKFILLVILTALISAATELVFPWWMIALVPFALGAAVNLNGGASFLAGFLGIAIFWCLATLAKDIPNEHILSQRMAILFNLSNYNLLIFVVSFVGGLVGGISAWAGSLVRKQY
ncbi:MAG: hypothetical protein H7257_09025 [Taibaiella sp.]|nr:hypothetical protein [Taibaiella sp.]